MPRASSSGATPVHGPSPDRAPRSGLGTQMRTERTRPGLPAAVHVAFAETGLDAMAKYAAGPLAISAIPPGDGLTSVRTESMTATLRKPRSPSSEDPLRTRRIKLGVSQKISERPLWP